MTRKRRYGIGAACSVVLIACIVAACTSTGTQSQRGTSYLYNRSQSAPPASAGLAADEADAGGLGATSYDWVTAGPLPPNEELWIIAAHDEDNAHQPAQRLHFGGHTFDVDDIGAGALVATPVGSTEFVPAPLQHTSVVADIAGAIASVGVTQTYANPFDVKIEATYVFPLPQHSAVSEFVMTVGERRIRGIVREREEAQRIYDEARGAGHVASLMTQERPNIFTQKVANIEPGRAIDIDITYYHTLPHTDGSYEFVFPMTVGPRYSQAGTVDGVGAVGRGDTGLSGQTTEITYLSPRERTGNTIDLTVHLDTGGALATIETPTHRTEADLSRIEDGVATVRLADDDVIPNKDFVLRYTIRAERTLPTLVTHRDSESGYFALTLHPPDAATLRNGSGEMPLEVIFVVDTSGSMSGRPLDQAKQAIAHTLRQLGPRDAFQIIRFANDASPLGDRVVPATERNVRDALRKLRTLDAKGGTEMLAGVRTALNFPHDRERLRFVCFLTDGYIGNEAQVLRAVDHHLGDARLFSFGVGSSVNRFLMERLAVMGRGAAAFLLPDESGADVMDAFLERVRTPALADVSIDWGDLPVSGVSPARVPDLYAGRPVTVLGRFDPRFDSPTTITVRGRTPGTDLSLPVAFAPDADTHPALADLWARAHIAEAINHAMRTPGVDPSAVVRETALQYALLSPYTAFIAVDASRVTEGDFGVSTVQPVNMPEGVRYDTTVAGDR
ncbi:MAG: VIT domain-containing protein [Phycisphaerales bacterium]